MTLAGLDIGTTTICGLLLDAGTGGIPAVITEPNSSGRASSSPGEALQDPETIVGIVSGILDRLAATYPDLTAVGVTGQMHGILYTDARGRAVSPLYTWQDGRGDREYERGVTHAGFLSRELGRTVSTGMGIVTHHYNVRHGLVPKDAVALCTIVDYAAMRLGRATFPVTDPTNAAGLGIFDLRRGELNHGSMERLGMDPRFLPSIETTYPVIGECHAGVPVIVGLGDNQASFLGSVRETAGAVLVNVGTGSQISVRIDDPSPIEGLDVRPLPGAGYLAVGAALCGGKAYAALRDFFQRCVRLFSADGDAAWDVMNRIDERSLDTTSRLRVDTRFSGTRADPAARGAVTGLGLDTFTPEHLIVGVREGIATELLDFYARVPAPTRASVRTLVGSGNGIRQNAGLRRAFENEFGRAMSTPAHREEASFGAALLAGVSVGVFPDLAAAGRLVRYTDD
jgi:sedoheptulokinase